MTVESYSLNIDEGVKVSESKIWKLLEDYYVKLGPKAWGTHATPSFATSNPITAEQYSALVVAYLKDCLANPDAMPLETSQPIYVLDLGAGSGQFGYAFLKKVLPMMEQNFGAKLKLCLVLTDIAEANFKLWENHPEFKPYFESDHLDYAYYRHSFAEEPLQLLYSKKSLSSKSLANPLILIGNYFFDSVPNDVFRCNNGVLQQGKIYSHVSIPKTESSDTWENPKNIKDIAFEIRYEDLKTVPYSGYEKSVFEKVAEKFNQEGDVIHFTFPIGGFHALNYFKKLSKGKFFLITGDHGAYFLEDFKRHSDEWISYHDSFSVPLNFFALESYFTSQKGFSLTTAQLAPKFLNSVSILGAPKTSWKETAFIFERTIETFNVSDYWGFLDDLKNRESRPSLNLLLEIIKLGRGDPLVIKAYHQELLASLPNADQLFKDKLAILLSKIADIYYYTDQAGAEFFLTLGELLYQLDKFEDAASLFEKGIEITEPSISKYKSLGACYLALGDKQRALECWAKIKPQ